MNILVSACLLGVPCRYDGAGGEASPQIRELLEDHTLIPVCPEQLGGLPTPRPPAELRGGRALTRDGADVTEAFLRGAKQALRIARLCGCTCAVLKEKSPSCGCKHVYDGSFTRGLIPGEGMTAKLLRENGLSVYGAMEAPELSS